MLKSMSPNASVVVHAHIGELVALCGHHSLGFFLGLFFFIFSSAVSHN